MRLGEYDEQAFDSDTAEAALSAHFAPDELNRADIRGLSVARRAAGALIAYLTATQKNSLAHIDHISLYRRSAYMLLISLRGAIWS